MNLTNLNRRLAWRGVASAAMCVLWMAASTGAAAQDYPNKPIRIIVPVPAGAGPDVDMRQMSGHLSTILGQPVIIENRPGAATRIAVAEVIKAAPDGYTFLVGTPSLTTMSSLYPKLAFDPKRDLVPVSLASVTSYTLTVNSQVPAQSVADFVKLAKSDPKYANFGTLGAGAVNHLTAAWFGKLTGVGTNYIHYGAASPFADLASGQIPAMFDAMLPLVGQVKSGRLRMLAISGKTRHPLMPDVPTFAEAGYAEFNPVVWIGIMAPAGTPAAIVKRMSDAMSQVAKMPETVALRRAAGSESLGTTPEEFAAFLDAERVKWSAVIKSINLTLE
jgi:tripartite-type tricarboxylate transporter receptor subunit TctC